VLDHIPFDPIRLRDVVLVKNNNTITLITRGVWEHIHPLCNNVNEQEYAQANQWVEQQGKFARRILAIAKKDITSYVPHTDLNNIERDMAFVGFIAFEDPLKDSARKAVQKAQKLHVLVKIISGDSKEVCGAVAKAVGIITDEQQVLLGSQFDAFNQ